MRTGMPISKEDVERRLRERMADGPFTSGELQRIAYDIGYDTPWTVVRTVIKKRAKAGEIVCERLGPFATWREVAP